MRLCGLATVCVLALDINALANEPEPAEVIEQDDVRAFEQLMKKGLDPRKKIYEGEEGQISSIEYALQSNALKILRTLFKKPGISAKGISISAARTTEALRVMLQNGADPLPYLLAKANPGDSVLSKDKRIGVINLGMGANGATAAAIFRTAKGWQTVDLPEGYVDLKVGKRFALIRCVDEMEQRCGVVAFDKNGHPIDLSKVKKRLEKVYRYAKRCLNVAEVGEELVFWDELIQEADKHVPYDCGMDSQSSVGEMGVAKHLFRLNPKTGEISEVHLKKRCPLPPAKNGKLLCK